MKLNRFYVETSSEYLADFPPTVFAVLATEDRLVFFTSYPYAMLIEQLAKLTRSSEYTSAEFNSASFDLKNLANLTDLLGHSDSSITHLLTGGEEGGHRSALVFNKGERKSYEGAPLYSGVTLLTSDDLKLAVALLNKKNMISKSLVSHVINCMNQYEGEHVLEDLISNLQEANDDYYQKVRLQVKNLTADILLKFPSDNLQVIKSQNAVPEIKALMDYYEHHMGGESDEAITNSKIFRALTNLLLGLDRKMICRHFCEITNALAQSSDFDFIERRVSELRLLLNEKNTINTYKDQDIIFGLFKKDIHKDYFNLCKFIIGRLEKEIVNVQNHKLQEGRENK